MLEAFGIDMHPYDQLRGEMTESDYIICVDSQKNAGNITDFIGKENIMGNRKKLTILHSKKQA